MLICASHERVIPRPATRFVIALVFGLALLTWVASLVVSRTTRDWFEKDVGMRAQLAVSGVRHGLLSHWKAEDGDDLHALLTELTRDERILAAAACGKDLSQLATTAEFPEQFGCRSIGVHVRQAAPSGLVFVPWKTVTSLPGGKVYVSAIPLLDQEEAVGFVVLVHDLSFIERREASVRWFLIVAFGFSATAAATITMFAARVSWHEWRGEIQRVLKGETPRPEFHPLLQDVLDLGERIAAERQADSERGVWTPQRLKQALNQYLRGERIIIVANREPYIHEHTPGGGVTILHPASGLVTALEPVMRACSGVWIAHGSGSADRETADAQGHVSVPPGEASYVIRRVWLSDEDVRGYYYGFANEGLWPLCHIADTRPVFRSEDWKHYQAVNQTFADAVAEEVDIEDPIVLVQDYHFALAPRLIRERLPRATVISFWHIPWPNPDRFGICPWRHELLEGLLGSSIVGFQTRFDCSNFIDAVDRYLESRIDRAQQAVVQQGRTTLVRPYPISTEWPVRWLETAPSVSACRAGIFAELGLPADALLGVGVDRLDYTKGLEERLLAVERLLERFPALCGRFTFAQLAAPSRTEIDRYRQLNDNVERVAARINERFGRGTYRPIVLLREHYEPPAVFTYYRAADLCYVSSLHDGMNLVAKEFVAARDDERGVLVLSQFAGAARELTEALIVNPYDVDEAAAALAVALEMPPDEQRARMRSMRAYLSEFNVYRWAGKMLVDAGRLRDRERLIGRLTHMERAT
ncbi:MAG: Alpha,alpha-trehalose-phosphate synthase (UDP-forming) [Deltaproteobacteria bacterium]|nr:Alpha,alpha-trehalose-phosphate synthase (UDP-forming) [Deltaproteobacteria bacterium]